MVMMGSSYLPGSDGTPVCPLTTLWIMLYGKSLGTSTQTSLPIPSTRMTDLADAHFPEACWEPELNASLAATGYTELGFDSTYHHATLIQEASALGCEIQWGRKDNFPIVSTGVPLCKGPDDIHIPAGYLEHRDTPCILRSTEMLEKEYGGEAAIIGKVAGLWTLGYHVFGVENFLLMSIEDPDMTCDASTG